MGAGKVKKLLATVIAAVMAVTGVVTADLTVRADSCGGLEEVDVYTPSDEEVIKDPILHWAVRSALNAIKDRPVLTQEMVKNVKDLSYEHPSLTVNKRQNSRKACIYGLCGCLFVCIDMCYIFAFVLVIFFVFEIIPRMEAFDINSKSVLNPNEL